jgi:phosphoglycolate phosphatase-like HAD superfamily hydrolase
MIELINKQSGRQIKAAVFDFDGTISTLRSGWEEIMEPIFYREINASHAFDENLMREIKRYIDESTGIQTVFQMRQLREMVIEYGRNPNVLGEWEYKDIYNKELLLSVNKKLSDIKSGKLKAEDFVIMGSREFLTELKKRGIKMFVASGTDDLDVKNECGILGFSEFFERIAGAPHRRADCSKEAILKELIYESGYDPRDLAVFGDGKVEISLARASGAVAIALATDEKARTGINPQKRQKLITAGADIVVGDFLNGEEILSQITNNK